MQVHGTLSLTVVMLVAATRVWAQQPPAPSLPAGTTPALPAPVTAPLPPSRWTAPQIREAFELADADSNGELTRAEAQRLPIMPRSFEDMDTNKDGVITLPEYAASFAQP